MRFGENSCAAAALQVQLIGAWDQGASVTNSHIPYIYIGSRLGVPRSFEEPSVLMLYQKGRSCIQMGGWGGVGEEGP